ncbi:MAG: agmatine deiminase family protein [Candidatus Krumholzibacteria bacterium]|nr:agmatine deiminase family protein [Candidatus Krumholzibacteria bacterium]
MNRRTDLRASVILAGLLLATGPLASLSHAERSTDGEEELLPIHETAAERALAQLLPRVVLVNDPPPAGPIRNVAEFEPCSGALIRYPLGISYALVKEMAEDVTVHVVVSSTYHATAAANFLSQGVDTARCEFIVEPNNSIWTRDYGPWFVFDGNGDQVILDHFYNRTARAADNAIPIALGARWGIPVVTHDLWHTGGNYMTEGHGLSFSSDLVWHENGPMAPPEVAQFMLDYYGVDDYAVLPDIALGGIHHIDTWGKLLDEETVLMKQVDPSHPDYDRIEANVATVSSLTNKYGRPFQVVRLFCPSISSGNVAAYTNALILNDKVLVPTFDLPADDAAALQVYRDHMPGYEVLGFSGGWLSDDALHCRVMGIHDRYLLRVDHDRVQQAPGGLPIPVTFYADDRSEAGIDPTGTALYWRETGAPTFQMVNLVPDTEPDWYRAQIPAQNPGTQVEYYLTARDSTGRVASRPRTAPAAAYDLTIDGPTGIRPTGKTPRLTLTVGPSPFRHRTVVRFQLQKPGPATLAVYDVRGRRIARLLEGTLPAEQQEMEWNGTCSDGTSAPTGVYFVVLEAGGQRLARRVTLLR